MRKTNMAAGFGLALLACRAAMAAGIVPAPVATFWDASEFTLLGDSIMAAAGGNVFQPAQPIVVTGTLTAGSNTITGLSSTAGMQVGAYLYGANLPAAALVTAVNAGAGTLAFSGTAPGVSGAQSITVQGVISNSFQTGLKMTSALGWLDALSGNGVNWRPAGAGAAGYNGNSGGIGSIVVVNGGTGFSASSTWTVAAPTVTPANQAGGFSCTATGGVIQSCAPPSPAGSGYVQLGPYSCTAGCGTGAQLSQRTTGSGMYATPGDVTGGIRARAADVCAGRPGWVIIDGGTNDIGSVTGTAALQAATAAAIANITAAVRQVQACGSRAVLFKVMARSTYSASGVTTAQLQSSLEQVNRAFERLGKQAYAVNPAAPNLVVVDPNRWQMDAGNAANPGYALAGMTVDGLHPALAGGFWQGVELRRVLGPALRFVPPTMFGQDDLFDATYAPSGNMLGSQGLFLGTGGSLGSSGCTGSVATGWTVIRTGTTNSLTCAASIESPRTDALSGQRQVLTLSATNGSATAAAEVLTLRAQVPSATYAALSAGDQVEMSCEINLSGDANIDRIGGYVQENASYGASFQQYGYALDGAATAGSLLPSAAKRVAMAAKLNGILPDFNPGGTDGAFTIYLHTMAPIPIQAVSGAGLYVYVDIGYEASTAETGTQATLKVANCAVRKVTS